MPRIISGRAGRTQLKTLSGLATRPSLDRMKESLFSILQPQLAGASFLDLFAGSGQIGLEAASRGAAEVFLVESFAPAQAVIRENIARCKLADTVRLLPRPAIRALAKFTAEAKSFDLIYMDPPWAEAARAFAELAPALAELMAESSWLIVEHAATEALPEVAELQRFRTCHYGPAMLSFYHL